MQRMFMAAVLVLVGATSVACGGDDDSGELECFDPVTGERLETPECICADAERAKYDDRCHPPAPPSGVLPGKTK